MDRQYLHVQCEAYSLLSAVQSVEQVIAGQWKGTQSQIDYHGEKVACINLLQKLTDNPQAISYHCLIMRNENKQLQAVLVGRVNRVQVIKDEDFDDLPNLDFPFNAYFDKVYMQQADKRCIYRLKDTLNSV